MSSPYTHLFPLPKLQMSSENICKNVKARTKLTLVDMHQLIELCVSECYFPYNNPIWKLYNSGPIGLSIMFVLSECYLQRPEE